MTFTARASHIVARRVRGNHRRTTFARGVDEWLEELHPCTFASPIATIGFIDKHISRDLAAQVAIDQRLLVAFKMLERERSAWVTRGKIFEDRELHRVRARIVMALADKHGIGP